MKRSLINKLCCPVDKSELQFQLFQENENHDIREGLLICTQCGRYYPVIYGVPIMTPDEYREKSLEEPMLSKWGISSKNNPQRFLLEIHNDKKDQKSALPGSDGG